MANCASVGDQVIGEYELLAELGRGTSAVVYSALHADTQRLVALKLLNDEHCKDEGSRLRFHREAMALSRVEHENVVSVLDYSGRDAERLFLVTERLTGRDLKVLVSERGAVGELEALALFWQAAQGLRAAHAEALIHRDLSLQNLFVDGSGRLVVTDFGLVAEIRGTASSETFAGRDTGVIGTPLYLAPEVLETRAYDVKSDVYALGVAFRYALLGKAPIAYANMGELLDAILAGRLASLAQLAAADVVAIADAMTARNPANRPADMSAVAELMEAAFSKRTKQRAAHVVGRWVEPREATLISKTVSSWRARVEQAMARGDVAGAFEIASRRRYRVEGRLGEGGMALVLRAHDTKLDRPVAVKLILDAKSEEAHRRFHREARAMGRLRHRAIVPVIDYSGVDAPLAYLVVAFIDGASLDRILTVKLFDETVALAVGYELASALVHVHEQDLVHRDVKPENVFVDQSGRLYLGDFGIVHNVGASSQTFGGGDTSAIGSPHFASPEQIFDPARVESRSDVFSLATTLQYCLTGTPAVGSTEISGLLSRLRRGELTPLPKTLSTELTALLSRMLRVDPSERPESRHVRDAFAAMLRARGETDTRVALQRFLRSEKTSESTASPTVSASEYIGPYRISHRVLATESHLIADALDERHDRRVTLQVFTGSRDDRARFSADAAKMMAFEHANVARIVDFSTSDGYVAFEFVPGSNLGDAAKKDGTVLAAIVPALRDAVAALHRAGLAHGRLSADLVRISDDGRPVLTGFVLPLAPGAKDADARALAKLTADVPPSRHAAETQALSARSTSNDEVQTAILSGHLERAIASETRGRYTRITAAGPKKGALRVFTAFDTRLNRHVTIKALLGSDADHAARTAFHREARALARVRHPNVIEVLDYSGRGAALPMLVLEAVEHVTLAALLTRGRLSDVVALCLLHELADAIAAVHAAGLIHGDIGPEAIAIDGDGRLLLSEFSLVLGDVGASQTFVGAAASRNESSAFASPEQARGAARLTTASDMFSLGAVLHAMLNGSSPFERGQPAETTRAVRECAPQPLPSGTPQFFVEARRALLLATPEKRASAAAVAASAAAELRRLAVLDRRREVRLFLADEDPRDPPDANATQVLATKVGAGIPARRSRVPIAALAVTSLLTLGVGGSLLRQRITPPRPALTMPVPAPAPPASTPAEPATAPALPPEPPQTETSEREGTKPRPSKRSNPSKRTNALTDGPAVLSIFTKPWAKVTIDGQPRGTTPFFRTIELAPGTHTIVFDNPSFATRKMRLTLRAGETKEVRIELEE